MRVWKNSDCQEIFGTLRKIYSTMMCAGGKSGMDTCQVINQFQTIEIISTQSRPYLLFHIVCELMCNEFQGDSGGPLICLNSENGHWEVCGIVSFGYRCGTGKIF